MDKGKEGEKKEDVKGYNKNKEDNGRWKNKRRVAKKLVGTGRDDKDGFSNGT